jgi:hypothetical protein
VSKDTLTEEVEAMVHDLDLNKDGAVDLWEFCVQMQIMKERKTEEERQDEVRWRAEVVRRFFKKKTKCRASSESKREGQKWEYNALGFQTLGVMGVYLPCLTLRDRTHSRVLCAS